MSSSNGRRTFLSTVASLAGLAATEASASQQSRGQAAAVPAEFDVAWLDKMVGKHKQLYDLGGLDLAVEPRPLRFARNFLDTFRDTYRLEFPDINAAVGISGPAFPMNASDRLWAKSQTRRAFKDHRPHHQAACRAQHLLRGPWRNRCQGDPGPRHDILAVQRGARPGRSAVGGGVPDAGCRRSGGSDRRTQSRCALDAVARDGARAGAGAWLHVYEALTW